MSARPCLFGDALDVTRDELGIDPRTCEGSIRPGKDQRIDGLDACPRCGRVLSAVCGLLPKHQRAGTR